MRRCDAQIHTSRNPQFGNYEFREPVVLHRRERFATFMFRRLILNRSKRSFDLYLYGKGLFSVVHELQHLDVSIRHDLHVGRLEIPMDDTFFVRGFECLANALCNDVGVVW